MDFRELKAFITVAEELNFRKASELLNMTQPPLTRLISQMEEDLGVKLFVRTTRKVELTGAGVHLLNESKNLLESIHKIEKEVRSIGRLKTGSIKVGLYGPVFHSELPKVISSFKEQFKGIKLDMSEVTSSNQLNYLKSGKLDVCFTDKEIDDEILGSQKILQMELGFLVHPQHKFAKKKSIKLTDLKNETLIFHGKHENLGFQQEFHTILRKKDIDVQVYYKKKKESCPHLAIMDKGIILSSKSMANHNHTGLKFVPLADYSSTLKFFVVWNKSNVDVSLKAFLSFFNESHQTPSSDMDYHLG